MTLTLALYIFALGGFKSLCTLFRHNRQLVNVKLAKPLLVSSRYPGGDITLLFVLKLLSSYKELLDKSKSL
jgi:hypothetical protein